MKKLKEWCKRHFNEIVTGILCTVITAGLTNIWKIFKEIEPTARNSVMRFFSNLFYVSLSKATDTSMLSLLSEIIFWIGIIYIVSLVHKTFSLSKDSINYANKIAGKSDVKSEKETKIKTNLIQLITN